MTTRSSPPKSASNAQFLSTYCASCRHWCQPTPTKRVKMTKKSAINNQQHKNLLNNGRKKFCTAQQRKKIQFYPRISSLERIESRVRERTVGQYIKLPACFKLSKRCKKSCGQRLTNLCVSWDDCEAIENFCRRSLSSYCVQFLLLSSLLHKRRIQWRSRTRTIRRLPENHIIIQQTIFVDRKFRFDARNKRRKGNNSFGSHLKWVCCVCDGWSVVRDCVNWEVKGFNLISFWCNFSIFSYTFEPTRDVVTISTNKGRSTSLLSQSSRTLQLLTIIEEVLVLSSTSLKISVYSSEICNDNFSLF